MSNEKSTNPLSDAAASITVTMNDETNTLHGLNNSMMISRDNGHYWEAYNEYYPNSFPGSPTVMVAKLQELALNSEEYDASKSYAGGSVVRYQGYYWTAQYWADPGMVPGVNTVWLKGDALNYELYGTFKFTPFVREESWEIYRKGKQAVANQRKVIGYFPEWGVYGAHDYFTPDRIDFSLLTHLNYGFAVVKDGAVVIHDTVKGPELLRQLAKLTKAHGVTAMVSVGGWNNSDEDVFEKACATDAGVEKLANSMVSFMRTWDFDGVDVDWEYPDNEVSKRQFTSLISKLRTKLNDAGFLDDRYYQLSAAVTTNHNNIQYINPVATAPLLDSVNVMAYDIHGAFETITGHNAPLFANSHDEDPLLNVASAMNEYYETWNVPKHKLMMGVPFYGRGWGNVSGLEVEKGLPGLFVAGTATVHGAWDEVDEFTGTNPFYVLKQKRESVDYVRYWDDQSKVPYLYSASKKEMLTYDDAESIQAKVDYINEQGFGGAIIWDISGDTTDFELGKIVSEIKNVSIANAETPHVNFYKEVNYTGAVVKVNEDTPLLTVVRDSAGNSVDNSLSSSNLGADALGYRVYTEYYYFGNYTTFTNNAATYSDYYNNSVSSIRIVKAACYNGLNGANEFLSVVGDIPDLWELSYDNMSSIKVLPGYIVRLYEGKYYSGAYRDVVGSSEIVNLSSMAFDYRAKSLKVIKIAPDPKVKFFNAINYTGDYLNVTDDIPGLSEVLNSQGGKADNTFMSSLLSDDCLGCYVYTDDNYSGSQKVIMGNVTPFDSTFSESISSVRIIKAIAYDDTHYSGEEIHILGDVPDLAALNFSDKISSIMVDPDYIIRLYDGVNFTGTYYDVTGPRTGLNISGTYMQNKASSLRFRKKNNNPY
ncbi:glycosyl hydrolase family 18 protein [Trabulsiella odontotermitis]|uniref:glycosyl hydrolase family 18 protein n=1 Tax=Trabulsiella odontotermitis TaxID=379893 RepID=UPI00092FD777|nr:glycosyl hydrolase family 18 protein [Trabulsiella odontotermitis]